MFDYLKNLPIEYVAILVRYTKKELFGRFFFKYSKIQTRISSYFGVLVMIGNVF